MADLRVVGVFSGFVVDEGVTGGMDDPRLVGVFRGFGVTGGFWGLVVDGGDRGFVVEPADDDRRSLPLWLGLQGGWNTFKLKALIDFLRTLSP